MSDRLCIIVNCIIQVSIFSFQFRALSEGAFLRAAKNITFSLFASASRQFKYGVYNIFSQFSFDNFDEITLI